MSRRRFGKAIGARSARKLIREIGGAPDPDLIAERERVLDQPLGNDEIVRLNDGRVLWISYGSADVYPPPMRTVICSLSSTSAASSIPDIHLGQGFRRAPVSSTLYQHSFAICQASSEFHQTRWMEAWTV